MERIVFEVGKIAVKVSIMRCIGVKNGIIV